MKTPEKYGKLSLKDGLVVCPVCRQKTHQQIIPETQAENLVLWCRHCKAVHLVKIDRGQCYMISRCR